MNPLWVLAVPLVVAAVGPLGRRDAAQGRPMRAGARPGLPGLLLVVVVAFGVLRNVPALAPWLAP